MVEHFILGMYNPDVASAYLKTLVALLIVLPIVVFIASYFSKKRKRERASDQKMDQLIHTVNELQKTVCELTNDRHAKEDRCSHSRKSQ